MLATLLKFCIIFHIVSTTAGCFHPGNKLHTIVTMSHVHVDGVYPVGTRIAYSCDSGFQILNNQLRNCSEDGTWSGSEPYCGIDVGGSGKVLALQPHEKDVVGKKLNDVFRNCNQYFLPPPTTWDIQLNKSYSIDRIKLTFKVNRGIQNTFDVPDVTYSLANDTISLNQQASKAFKHNKLFEEHTYLNRRSVSFQYDNDSPFPCSVISLTIHGLEDNLALCDITLYSSSVIPEDWCGSDDDRDTKHLLYDDKCYIVIGTGDGTKWSQARTLCRQYNQGDHSELAKFTKNNNNSFNYISHTLRNDAVFQNDLSKKYYWISDGSTDHCLWVKFPNRDQTFFQTNSEGCTHYEIGRICEYDIPKCGSPDQNDGTVMVFHERNATYSCPKNFELVGNALRFCSNGQWSPPAPTCARLDHNRPDSCSCACNQPKKEKVITIDLTIELVVDDDSE